MASIRVQTLNDLGEELNVKTYELGIDLGNLSKIEAQIEGLRPELLTDITHDLLSTEQKRYEKKRL